MYPYGQIPLAYMYDRNGVRGLAMNSKPVKKRAIQAWRDGDMSGEYNVYPDCFPVNGSWHIDHNDRQDGHKNLDNSITWSPSSVSECPSQTDSEVESDINTSFSHTAPENIDASFYSDEKKKTKRSKKKQLAVVLDRIVVNKTDKQKTQEVLKIPGMGIASERMPTNKIQPIILDFEIPLPKETVQKAQADKEENSLKRVQNSLVTGSPDTQLYSDEPSAKKSRKEESSESSGENATTSLQIDQPHDKTQEESGSKTASTNEDLFKKPDINQYKASTGGVRCFICQRQIIADGTETAFFGMVVCVPCKKIQDSGGPALPTPVPKFPTSCHPKLFRGSKYVRTRYGRSPSPGQSPSGSRSPARSPATSPAPRSPMSPYRSNPVSPFSKPPLSPAVPSPRPPLAQATPPASPKGSAPLSRTSTPVPSTPPVPNNQSDKSPNTSTVEQLTSMSPHHPEPQSPHLVVSQPSRVLGHSPQSPGYHSLIPSPVPSVSQTSASSPLRINVSPSPERRLVSSPNHAKSDKFSPPHMSTLQMPTAMHRPPRILSLATPCSRSPQVELPNNDTGHVREVPQSSQPSPQSNQQSPHSSQQSPQPERTHQEHETIRALLKLRRQDQQHMSISGPPPLIQTPGGGISCVGSNGPPGNMTSSSQLPPGVIIPGVPPPRSMYPGSTRSIPQGFIPSTVPGGFPRIQMMPLQRMPVEAFIPRTDISGVQNHIQPPASNDVRYQGIETMPNSSIPVPKIAEVRTLNPGMLPGMSNISMVMTGYPSNVPKRPRKKKNAVMVDNMMNNQALPGQYRGEKQSDQSGKETLVIVGTNCGAGSSSIKVGNDKEPEPQYMIPGQPTKPFPDGIPRPIAFHCVCQGKTITFIQCPNCDFICNSVDGMELHFAAQRHAEIRGEKESTPGNPGVGKYPSESAEGSTKPVGDDVVSLSSVETQSADTDSEMSSPLPKNMQENWRILNSTSDMRYERNKPAYTSALDLRVGGSKSTETPDRPTPLDLSQKQTVSNLVGVTRPQTSSGQVIESTIPLDLSSHIEHARHATREPVREAFSDATREGFIPERYLQGGARRQAAADLVTNQPYYTQSQLESEARARMVLVDNSPLYSISRGAKIPPTSYEYTSAGPGTMQLVRPPRSYPAQSTIPNRDLSLYREAIRPPRPEEYLHMVPPPHLIQKEQQRIDAQRSGSVTVQQLLRSGHPPQRTNQQTISNLQFHSGYPAKDVINVSLPLPNLVRAQPRATVAPSISQSCQINYQGGTISVHSTAQQLKEKQDNLRELQQRQREAFERQAITQERRKDMQREMYERQEELAERQRRDIQEKGRQREIQERERQRDMHEQHADMQSRQRNMQEREGNMEDRAILDKQRDLHEFHRGPKGRHKQINNINQGSTINDVQVTTAQNNLNNVQNTEWLQENSDRGSKQRENRTLTNNVGDTNGGVHVKSEPVEVIIEEPRCSNDKTCENGQLPETVIEDDMRHLAEAEQYKVNAAVIKQESIQLASA
ncbi:protein piccolo-like isoform X2 [Anneissia japonica]|nr:protein piccolo-like isoform X2 [Anneissia japonica]XP_033104763.1 protein piccolo-like isoform X2 [Anneissia japonica]XP_033104765.1 protein piccolo-like isoform X2 [Anneissia japonica]